MNRPSFITRPALLVLCAVLALPGCSRLASSSGPDGTQDVSDDLPVNWAEVEDFDPDRYADEQPAPRPDITHDVPAELLRRGGSAGVSAGVQSGFRISIFSSTDPLEADRTAAAAAVWWQRLQNNGELDNLYTSVEYEPPIYQDYRAPYYRVRIGNFAERADAQRMLDLVEDRYPNAFIVPDQVILR